MGKSGCNALKASRLGAKEALFIMPASRQTSLKSAQNDKKIGKVGSSSGSKKSKSQFTVGPVVLALFLFVVVGSAILQIISSAQRGLVWEHIPPQHFCAGVVLD